MLPGTFFSTVSALSYLFGRSMAVVLFSPELRLHLQPDVFKVNISVHRLHVTLGHIVRCWLPVAAVWEIRQLLPARKWTNIVLSNTQIHLHASIVQYFNKTITHNLFMFNYLIVSFHFNGPTGLVGLVRLADHARPRVFGQQTPQEKMQSLWFLLLFKLNMIVSLPLIQSYFHVQHPFKGAGERSDPVPSVLKLHMYKFNRNNMCGLLGSK